MSGAIETLFLPFASGDIDPPDEGARFAFLNAAVPPLPGGFASSALACEQGFRPAFLALQRAGFDTDPELDAAEGAFDACLVLAGRHKGENQALVARACALVKPGASIVVCGEKTVGIQPLRKWVGGRVEIAGSLAKHHATVFWFDSPGPEIFAGALETTALVADRFETAPGMFSHTVPDAGSVLLAAHLDHRIKGTVADFGCGWGYLSAEVLEKGNPGSLALFEAHHPSLKAAERNLAPMAGEVKLAANWCDLTSEPVARQFDWIVMNPPFPAGRASEPDIGKAFIAAASKALVPGGRLLMVANRKLPYERALAQGFRRVEEKEVRDGFKVVEAMR